MHITEERNSVTLENKGQRIFGILHLPIVVEKGPVPAVVICHGFGGTKSGRYRLYVSLAEKMVESGIAVFRFDYRGSGDSEGDPTSLTFDDHILDTMQALKYVIQHPQVDAKRIGVLGKSLGAAVATVAAAEAMPHVRSIMLWAPFFHAQQWKKQWKDIVAKKSDQEKTIMFQGYPVNMAFVQELFALDLKKDLEKLDRIPMCLVEPMKDEVLTKDHFQGYLDGRQHAQGFTHRISIDSSDHDFSTLDEQKILLQETHKWFNDTLFDS